MSDKLIIGGHEFTSRFILGSGKYNPELIRAAVEHHAGAAPRQQLQRKYPGTYSGRRHAPSEYFRREKCRRGREDRPAGKRSRLR